MKNTLMRILCNGFAKVTALLLSKNIGLDILDDGYLTDACSPTSARKKVPFQV
jgi:hypothetical protein